jgi:hypothetical protein
MIANQRHIFTYKYVPSFLIARGHPFLPILLFVSIRNMYHFDPPSKKSTFISLPLLIKNLSHKAREESTTQT